MADITISASNIAENATGEIATLTCEGAASYRLIADQAILNIFEVVGDKLVVKEGAILDYEIQGTYHFDIEALDADGNPVGSLVFAEANPFTLSNLNDNEPGGIRLDGQTSLDIPESTQAGAFIGTLSATDADGDEIVDYTLVGGSDFFEIVNDGGVRKVQLRAGLDYEVIAHQKHTLRIKATDDGGLSSEQDITVNVTNVNDNEPTGVTLSNTTISESAKTGDIVGELSATDVDGDLIAGYSLKEPSRFFAVDLIEGKWVVLLKDGIDYETVEQRVHVLKVIATDGVNDSAVQEITITVTNENDNRPTVVRLNGQVSADVSESTAAGSDIGVLSATDADGNPITGYDLVGQSTLFEIAEAGGRWILRLKAGLDYEGTSQHVLKIIAKDGVNTSDAQDITINVTNINDNKPTGIVLSNTSLSESAKVGDVIGILSATDADGDSITEYAFDEPNDFFYLERVNGAWQVKLKAGVDYETVSQRVHVLKITATDGVRTSAVHEITINVVNVNEAPTNIAMTGGTIGDNAIIGATVATLAGQDPDRGDQLTYTIVDGETGTVEYNHPYFGISGNEIVVKSDLGNAPIGVDLPVYVKVTDANGLFYVKELTLNVAYVNKAPTINSDLMEVLDGAKGGTIVAVLSAQDVDSNHLTFKLSKTSSTWFHLVDNLNGSYSVVVNDGFTLELGLAAFESFVVEVSDNNNNTTTETVFLNINENLEPESTFEFLEVEKNTPGGTLVGTLVGYDPEGQTVDYTLLGDSANLFTLLKNADATYSVFVKQDKSIDYDDDAQHSFTVMVSDGFNAFEESFDLVFGNSLPKMIFVPVSVKEGVGAGTVVGKLAATDFDGDELTYSLSDASSEFFELVRNTKGGYDVVVRASVILDYENEDHHSVEVEVTDGIGIAPKTVNISLTDVNIRPNATYSSVVLNEAEGEGIVVGTVKASDAEDEDVVCTLSAESEAFFELMDNSDGNFDIAVRDGIKLDYENPFHRVVNFVVSDGVHSFSRSLNLNLTDGVDTLTGTTKADALTGTAGKDIIKGLTGNDSLVGNTGNDTLYGGAGKDVLNGGMGQDVFVFDAKPNKKTNLDKVADFSVTDDSIWLENKVFTKLGKKGSEAAPAQLKKSFFTVGDRAKDKDDHIVYSKKTGKLYFDVDGSGSKAAVEIATLSKKLAMTNKDFFVI